MDLNLLYSQHQVSLIHAAAASSRHVRADHLATAGRTADLIRQFQLAEGAAAAPSWNKPWHMDDKVPLRCADAAMVTAS